MSTVRIQVRRGLSTGVGSWNAINPILAAGEIGLETDTGKFKFGYNNTAWNSLPYALSNSLADYIPLSLKGVADGVAELDADGLIPVTQLPPLAKVTVSSVADQTARLALTAQVGDIAIQTDTGASYVLQTAGASTNANWKELVGNEKVQDVIGAMLSGNTETGITVTYEDSDGTIDFVVADQFTTHSTSDLSEGTNLYFTDERAQDAIGNSVGTGLSYNDTTGAISVDTTAIQAKVANITDTEIGYLDGVTSAIQSQLNDKAASSSPTFSGTVGAENMTLSGNLTVNGTTTTINSTAINVNNQVVFEGLTADGFETTLSPTDPTADRSIFLPDASGTIVLSSDTQTLTNKTINLTSNTLATTLTQLNTAVSDADLATLAGAETLTNKTLNSPNINEAVALTATSSELNVLDGITSSTAQLNILNGVTATTAEINKLAGVTATTAEINKLAGVTATSSEINILSGVTATAAEINVLDGVTATTAEINKLAGVTATTAEINKLAGVTATSAEINALSGLTSTSSELNILDGVTATAAEINVLAGVTATTAEINKLAGVTATSSEINILSGVTATAAEINILDGATLSVTELNYVDGVTSAIQTQLNNKQAVVADVSDTEIGYLNGVTSNIQTQLNAKASLESPTFTGIVTLPANTISQSMMGDDSVGTNEIGGLAVTNEKLAGSIGWDKLAISSTVSAIEAGYLDGVTSAIQTQLNGKQATVANVSDVEIGYLDGVTSGIQTQLDAKAPLASPTFTGTVTLPSGTVTSTMILDGTIANADINASAAIDWTKIAPSSTVSAIELGYLDGVTSAIQTQLDAKAPSSSPTFTGTVTSTNDVVVNGNLTVNGTTFNASSTSITIEDNMVQLAHQNAANTVDLGLIVGYNDGSAKHAGLVRDVSDAKWKLFKGVTTEPSTTVDFTQGSLDDLKVAAFEATTVTPSSGVVFTDGTQTLEGVPSRTPIIQKTASYTLSALTERDDLIEMGSASAITLSIPTDATLNYPVGTSIDILQTGAGQVTIAAVTPGTTTVNATPGLKLRTQWSSCTLFKRAANTWVVFGDLTA
jgi:hypothetical protein